MSRPGLRRLRQTWSDRSSCRSTRSRSCRVLRATPRHPSWRRVPWSHHRPKPGPGARSNPCHDSACALPCRPVMRCDTPTYCRPVYSTPVPGRDMRGHWGKYRAPAQERSGEFHRPPIDVSGRKRDGLPRSQGDGPGTHHPARSRYPRRDSCLSTAVDRRVFAGRAEADGSAPRQEHGRSARTALFAEAGHEQPVPAAYERADAVVHQKSTFRG